MILKSIFNLIGIALAEVRSDFRLARTWIFIAISVILVIVSFASITLNHWQFSGISSFLGFNRPTGGMLQLGPTFLLVFFVAITFLAFDIQTRDKRDRIAEVIGSRPVSNFELLFGRGLGIVLLFSTVATLLLLVLQCIGWIGTWQDWVLKGTFEPYSLIGFLIFDLVPNNLFWVGLVILLTVLLRYRLLVAVVAITILALQFQLVSNLPANLLKQFGGLGTGLASSEITPFFIDWPSFAMRIVWVAAGIGLIYLAAAMHPRIEGPIRGSRTIVGAGVLGVAVLLGFLVSLQYTSEISDRNRWFNAHSTATTTDVVDIQSIQGTVTLDPGNELHAALELEYLVPSNYSREELLFSLNPNFEIIHLRLNDQEVEYVFVDGLLRLNPTAIPTTRSNGRLEITYRGYPNPLFGYLDGSIDFLSATGFDSSVLFFLGTEASLFDSSQVVLTPAVAWYPKAGVNVFHDRLEEHQRDFFDLDISVNVPKGWNVAGPSRRNETQLEDSTRYDFKAIAPLPSIALVAGEFVTRNTEIEGIQFEIMLSKQHDENLEVFADLTPLIRETVEEFLKAADKYGIPYPYDSLTLVEVSDQLRLFGGGWRMDTAFNMPGVIFLRESAFPTANFDRLLQRLDDESMADDQQRAEYKFAVLQNYFENDVNGGNLYEGVVRNLSSFQTEASGHGGTVLSYLVAELTKNLLFEYSGFFSAFLSTSQQALQSNVSVLAVGSFSDNDPSDFSMDEAIREREVNNSQVWEAALDTPLSQLDYDADPQGTLNVLALKVSLLADELHAYAGDEVIGSLLASLREKYRGTTYTVDDFQSLLHELDTTMEGVVGNWLEGTGLPGFIVSTTTLSRLNDTPTGEPVYETSISIRNDEPTPGIVILKYRENTNNGGEALHELIPTRIAGHASTDFNIQSGSPIAQITIDPMLSLNRAPITIEVDEDAEWTIVDRDPKPMIDSTSEWQPDPNGYIVVDDLDQGFSTTFTEESIQLPGFLSIFGVQVTPTYDQGLPAFRGGFQGGVSVRINVAFGTWQRATLNSAYGKYRRTTARVSRGDGLKKAFFKTELPNDGNWELEYHIPWQSSNRRRSASTITDSEGEYDILVVQGETDTKVEFDASAGVPGWNSLGEFQLSKGSTEVVVSDKSTGQIVWADAIRWSEVN